MFLLTEVGSAQSTIPPLCWPTDRGATVIVRFGVDWVDFGCDGLRKLHVGLDIKVNANGPVYAAEDGIVRWRGTTKDHPEWKEGIVIEHNINGVIFTTVYWHINPSVKIGDLVTRRQQIGTVADMGKDTHLHFGIRHAPYSEIAIRGALPRTKDCPDGPKFPEKFIDPLNYQGRPIADPINRPPVVDRINQYRSDGITTIREGGAIKDHTVVFKATMSDPNGGRVRLQIELRQITEPFTGSPTWDSGFVRSGMEVIWKRGGLVDGRYKWRYRVIDEENLASSWQEFGTAGNVDFIIDRTPPMTPTNLRVTGSTFGRIDLAWNSTVDNISGIAGYKIYRNGQLLAILPATQTSYRDESVAAGQRYCYTVAAIDLAGNESSRSNEVCARAVPWMR